MPFVMVFSMSIFLVSLTIHLLTLLGPEYVPPLTTTWLLFFPLMVGVIWANAHIILQRKDDYVTLPPGEFWRFISRNAPRWMRSLQVGVLLYALFNFYFTMLVINRGGYPRIVEGQYVLESHKVVLEFLTRDQYLWHAGAVVRMLTGITMAVSFAALMRWVARWRTVETDDKAASPLSEEATS